jgi:hypothetical protein
MTIVIIVTCTAAPRGTVTAAASFERLIIRFSEAVNRKAYILHNSPGNLHYKPSALSARSDSAFAAATHFVNKYAHWTVDEEA